MLMFALKSELTQLNRFVEAIRLENDETFRSCARTTQLRESEKQLKSFTTNEFTKLENKYSTIQDHKRLEGELEKQLQAIDGISTSFEKQTTNFQSRL